MLGQGPQSTATTAEDRDVHERNADLIDPVRISPGGKEPAHSVGIVVVHRIAKLIGDLFHIRSIQGRHALRAETAIMSPTPSGRLHRMGLFGRKSEPASSRAKPEHVDLATQLFQGEDMIDQLARAHMSWGLGSADRWGLDQRTGVITWTFSDKTATAPAQIIGSYNPSTASWLWAWANQSILTEMSRDSRKIRDWGEAHGQLALTESRIDNVDEENAATLAALAVRITQATGFYRGTGSASIPIITFGAVTLTTQDGATSTFKIDVVS